MVGEASDVRGASPDYLDPFTVTWLPACQGLAGLSGDEGVYQFVCNVHAEPRQATALLASMLRLALPDTCGRLVEKLMSEEIQHRKNLNESDLNRRIPTIFDRPESFVDEGKQMAVHIFADSSFMMSNKHRT